MSFKRYEPFPSPRAYKRWPEMNRRRGELIDKKVYGQLTPEELEEFEYLQRESAAALARRLGNRLGALPHTVVIDGSGRPVLQKVGPYTEAELDDKLRLITSN